MMRTADSESTPRVWDRSRTLTDWQCPRRRYWGYEFDGRGITNPHTSLELTLGIAVHDALALLATQQLKTTVDIDLVAEAARQQVADAIIEGATVDVAVFAAEQGALVEGLLRGFYRHVWPRLLRDYPNIVLIEPELEYPVGDTIFMSKPDLVLGDTQGDLHIIEYKTTSTKKEEWITSWETAVQVHAQARAVGHVHGTTPLDTTVVGLYKGYCLTPETPVLTADLRWIPVGDLKVQDHLAAFEEQAGNNRSGGKALRNWQDATVTRTGRQTLPCYQIVLSDGTQFTCTGQHKWLTAQEGQGMGSAKWTTTEDLTCKHRIVKIIEPWKGLGEFEPYDAGYLAGAFDGEGSLVTMQFDSGGKEYASLNLNFTQNPNQMLVQMKRLCDKYGITWSGNQRTSGRRSETMQMYGKIKLLSLLGKIRPARLLPKLDFNRLGMIKHLPVRPVRVVEKRFVGPREVVTLETSTGTFIANGFASHNSSYGKQNSPFCYGYLRAGNPPFTPDIWRYDYAAGYKRTPVWDKSGGVKQWVERMPDEVIAEQFPCTPPIHLNYELIDRWFTQRSLREKEMELTQQALAMPNLDPEMRQGLLDVTYPQHFSQCQPGYGHPCEFKRICHGNVTDPLNAGYQYREPHHAREMNQFQAEETSSDA